MQVNNNYTAQYFYNHNTSFLTLTSGYLTYLATAQYYLSQAADDITDAITKVQTRNTAAYLINLKEMTSDEITKAKANLARGKLSLSSEQTVYEGADGILGGAGGADDIIINLSPFFAGINLRGLLPPFTNNQATGLFPDDTMGGIIMQGVNPNEDLNTNGIPDILEE